MDSIMPTWPASTVKGWVGLAIAVVAIIVIAKHTPVVKRWV